MNKKTTLILGDGLAIALLTVIGFATHGEMGVSYILRMGTTFIPVCISWFLISPWLGLFDETVVANSKLLWRILLAMLFAAPLAASIRAVLLHSAALPIFTLILGATNGLGILIWRGICLLITRRAR